MGHQPDSIVAFVKHAGRRTIVFASAYCFLLDLTEHAAASPRFWADSAGRYAGDGHRTAGGSVDSSGSGSTWRCASQQQERRLLAWMGNRQLGWNSGREGELGWAALARPVHPWHIRLVTGTEAAQ
jgi:hypothetical protein